MKKEKNDNSVLKEYAKKLYIDDLNFLMVRLSQRLGSDLSEAAELMQRDKEIDKWLCSASNHAEWYEKIDRIGEFLRIEIDRR